MGKLVRSLISIVALAVALVPLWVYLLASNVLAPEGFWQRLVVIGAGIWILGGLQIVMLGAWLVALFFIWGD